MLRMTALRGYTNLLRGIILVASISGSATTAPRVAVAEELPPPEVTNEIRQALQSALTFGDGADAMFEDALSKHATSYGVPWWKVFGMLVASDKISSDLRQGDYSSAMREVGRFAANEMLSADRALSKLAGSAYIANLAALPIESQLDAIVDAVSNVGFQYQERVYEAARSEPFSMSHDEIIAQARPDPTITYDDFGYLRTVGSISPPWISRPDARISREETYAILAAGYDAHLIANEIDRQKKEAVAEFQAVFVAGGDAKKVEQALADARRAVQLDQAERAYEILKPLAEMGSRAAIAEIVKLTDAPISADGELLTEIYSWLDPAARAGNIMAQTQLGIALTFGEWGHPIAPSRALDLHRKVLARTDATSDQKYNSVLGVVLVQEEFGLVPEQEWTEILNLLHAAADSGKPFAIMRLAELYAAGGVVKADVPRAERFLLRIIDGDHSDGISPVNWKGRATAQLGAIYDDPESALHNESEALRLFQLALGLNYCPSWTVMSDRSLRCNLLDDIERLKIEIRADECATLFGQEPTSDVLALFECDQPRAIASFAKEHEILFTPDRIQVQLGRIFATDSIENSECVEVRERLSRGYSGLADMFESSSCSTIRGEVNCWFDLDQAERIREDEEMTVTARLVNFGAAFAETQLDFSCR